MSDGFPKRHRRIGARIHCNNIVHGRTTPITKMYGIHRKGKRVQHNTFNAMLPGGSTLLPLGGNSGFSAIPTSLLSAMFNFLSVLFLAIKCFRYRLYLREGQEVVCGLWYIQRVSVVNTTTTTTTTQQQQILYNNTTTTLLLQFNKFNTPTTTKQIIT